MSRGMTQGEAQGFDIERGWVEPEKVTQQGLLVGQPTDVTVEWLTIFTWLRNLQ